MPKLEEVKQDESTLQYIKSPTEEELLKAVKQVDHALQYVDTESPEFKENVMLYSTSVAKHNSGVWNGLKKWLYKLKFKKKIKN